MTRQVQVLGAGGHGKVIVATLRLLGFDSVLVYDDRKETWGTTVLGCSVVGPGDAMRVNGGPAVLGVGHNATRARLADELGLEWVSVIHPAAIVHESVDVGAGAVIFAGAVIQPDTIVGRHAIVNTSASVDHDCVLDPFVHLGPGVHLCGGVRVGTGTLIGVGASVIPCIEIGEWSIIGGGACCARNVPPRSLAVGVPAKVRGTVDR